MPRMPKPTRSPVLGYNHNVRYRGHVFHVQTGTLYPALHRLVRRGWISAAWQTTDNGRRAALIRQFEQRVMTEAHQVPFLWWNRLVAMDSRVMGWSMSPSHVHGQDLVDVWLAPATN